RAQGRRAGRGRRSVQAAAGQPRHHPPWHGGRGGCGSESPAGPDPMNISAGFIKRPVATAMLMVGLLLLGLAAYPLMPVAALPNVNYPTIQVSAQLPGADPQTMASSVATPLEEQFGQIPGITQMTSASALGFTQISLQFNLSRSVDSAATDPLSPITAASAPLPPRCPPRPRLEK